MVIKNTLLVKETIAAVTFQWTWHHLGGLYGIKNNVQNIPVTVINVDKKVV